MNIKDILTNEALPADVRDCIRRCMDDESARARRRDEEYETLKSVLDSVSDGIVVCDINGNFLLFNKAAERIVGRGLTEKQPDQWQEIFGVFLPDRLTPFPADQFPLMRALRGEDTDRQEQFIRNPAVPNGVLISVNGRPWRDRAGNIKGGVAVFQDVTELAAARKALQSLNDNLEGRVHERTQALQTVQEQLMHSQKLDGIGRLAGGIAHDFNNMLMAILGFSDLAIREVGTESKAHEHLLQVKSAGERAANLTRQLLAFSRKQVLQPKVVDLNGVVKDLHRMFKPLIGENIAITLVLGEQLSKVFVDPGQMEQVILNLAVNARDAMPNGGKLTIETHSVHLDAEYASHHAEVTPGEYVMLAVSDTGTGMDKETLSRIFEPFFTTKEQGKGTGLGLATLHGIVKQSGGHIWVYSEPGKGATFKVYMPAATKIERAEERDAGQSHALEGKELVLLVEDEALVRSLAMNVLTTYGYRVLEAADGDAALRICMACPQNIDLLLTDVVMPSMSGTQLATEFKKQFPAAKVIYMSGYTENAIVHHGVLDKGVNFLQKPMTPGSLARKLREVLDAPQA